VKALLNPIQRIFDDLIGFAGVVITGPNGQGLFRDVLHEIKMCETLCIARRE
jgi:hypothetical protein